MPFSTFCTNKGCGKIQEPFIDPQDNKVYCSLCEGELTNITPFVKTQMRSMKQYRPKQAKPFACKCLKCGREERPRVVDNDIVCGACHQPMDNLSPIFKNMLKERLKTVDKDV